MASQYLLKSIRTLRHACRDISLARPDSSARDCGVCILAELCERNHERSAETDLLNTAFKKAWIYVEFDPMLGVLETSERQAELARCLMALLKLGETNPTSLANSAIRLLHKNQNMDEQGSSLRPAARRFDYRFHRQTPRAAACAPRAARPPSHRRSMR